MPKLPQRAVAAKCSLSVKWRRNKFRISDCSGYTAANSSGGQVPDENHTFAVAIDPSGSMYATRAGPGSGAAGASFWTQGPDLVVTAGPYNPNFADPLTAVTAFQIVGSVNMTLSQMAARMNAFSAATNANHSSIPGPS